MIIRRPNYGIKRTLKWTESATLINAGNRGIDFYDDIIATVDAKIFRRAGGVWNLEADFSSSLVNISTSQDSVGCWNDLVVIGYDIYGTGTTGKVNIYRYNGGSWGLEQTLIGPSEFSAFGDAVKVYNDVVVVSCNQDATNPGAYVYRYNGGSWGLEQILTNSLGLSNFGTNVDIYNDTIITGRDDFRLFVFNYGGGSWSETQILNVGKDSRTYRVHDGLIIADQISYETFRIFRETGGTWSQEYEYVYGSPVENNEESVSIYGDLAVVGRWASNQTLVFRRIGGSWTLEETLVGGGQFGYSCAIWGTTIAILARTASTIYIYDY